MRAIILVVAILGGGSAQADIYKCVVNGKTVFSQQPCAPDAVEVQPKVAQPSAAAVAEQAAVTASLSAAADRMEHERKTKENARQLDRLDAAEAAAREARDTARNQAYESRISAIYDKRSADEHRRRAAERDAAADARDRELNDIHRRRMGLLHERNDLNAAAP
jgi:hypothetical protein